MQAHFLFEVAKRLPLFVRTSAAVSAPILRSFTGAAVVTSATPSKKRTPRKRGRPVKAKPPPKDSDDTNCSKNFVSKRSILSSDGVEDRGQCERQDSKANGRQKRVTSHNSSWQGLSMRRQRRMRVVEYDADDLIRRTVSSAIVSAVDFPHNGLQLSLAIASAAGISPPVTTHATLIRATVRSAQRNLPNLACVPDIAIEAFLRLSSGAPPSVEAIAVVASLCAEDPVLERRAGRAASILRYILAAKVEMTQSTLCPIFDLFISSLDMKSAAYMLRFFDVVCDDVSSVDRAYWYDRLSYAALLRQTFEVAQLVLQEKDNLELPDTPYGKSVALSLHAENGSRDLAESTAHSLERCNISIEPFARAALIRAAGRANDTQAMWRHFQAFEDDLAGCPLRYASTLSFPARHGTATVNDYSGMTSRMQLADPTVAMFDALRMCNKGEDALGLVMRLRKQYNVRFSKMIYEIVSQTCFRSKRLDLAVQFRKLVQAEKDEGRISSVQTLSSEGALFP